MQRTITIERASGREDRQLYRAASMMKILHKIAADWDVMEWENRPGGSAHMIGHCRVPEVVTRNTTISVRVKG